MNNPADSPITLSKIPCEPYDGIASIAEHNEAVTPSPFSANAERQGVIIEKEPNGTVTIGYWSEGKLHRHHAEGPALRMINVDGKGGTLESYLAAGKNHRPVLEGPSAIRTDLNGRRVFAAYYENDCLHRDPALEAALHSHDEYGERIQYALHGKFHRNPKDGPAYVWVDEQTRITHIKYYVMGKLHRDPGTGPAVVYQYADGTILEQEYWVDGEPYIAEADHA